MQNQSYTTCSMFPLANVREPYVSHTIPEASRAWLGIYQSRLPLPFPFLRGEVTLSLWSL